MDIPPTSETLDVFEKRLEDMINSEWKKLNDTLEATLDNSMSIEELSKIIDRHMNLDSNVTEEIEGYFKDPEVSITGDWDVEYEAIVNLPSVKYARYISIKFPQMNIISNWSQHLMEYIDSMNSEGNVVADDEASHQKLVSDYKHARSLGYYKGVSFAQWNNRRIEEASSLYSELRETGLYGIIFENLNNLMNQLYIAYNSQKEYIGDKLDTSEYKKHFEIMEAQFRNLIKSKLIDPFKDVEDGEWEI
jgi:hypothetical protein